MIKCRIGTQKENDFVVWNAAKLLWKGVEFWDECLELLAVAEQANRAQRSEGSAGCNDGSIVLRRYFFTSKKLNSIFKI
jgi:hypothetical protein